MHKTSGTLKAVGPFDFGQTLGFLRAFGPMVGEQRVDDGSVTKAVMVDGRVAGFTLRGGKTTDEVNYELFSEKKLDEATAGKVADRISFFLSLDDDVGQFYSIAEKDRPYYPKVKQLWGLHHVKFPSLLEICCWAIINQRIQRPIALRIKKAMMERYGDKIELEGRVYWAFPDYERLKAAKPSELFALTRNQRVAERLGSLLANFGDLDEGFLREAPYAKAEERLKKVKGIGDWSAQFILFRGLGRIERQHLDMKYNAKPVIRMMEEVYGPGKTLDDINRTYGKWCGYWSLYLWGSSMIARDEN